MLMNPYLLLTAGIIWDAIGGELFVRGVVGIAQWARVSAGFIGATLVQKLATVRIARPRGHDEVGLIPQKSAA